MEDPLVTAIWFQDHCGAVKQESDRPSAFNTEMHSARAALLQGSSSWERSFHNLKYGLSPHETTEDFMTYQGPAQYRKENDRTMAAHYLKDQQERFKAELVQRKFEEKHAELEQQRRQVEQIEAEPRSSAQMLAHCRRTRFVLAKQQENLWQQQAIFNRQYPQYAFSAPMKTRSPDFRGSIHAMHLAQQRLLQQRLSAATSIQTSPVRPSQLLDQTITESPTYRSSPALTYRAAVRGRPPKATPVQARPDPTAIDLNGYDLPLPQPSGMTKRPRPQPVSDQRVHIRAAAYSPTSSVDSPLPDGDMIEVRRRSQRQTSTIPAHSNATSPVFAKSEDKKNMFSDHLETKGPSGLESPASPSLAEIIGSETPSEAEDEDEGDGDEDFDPHPDVGEYRQQIRGVEVYRFENQRGVVP
ncbi:hypothetical protein H2200_005522 [Cladophialophora chaetospira]|uniref:Uncharacterized protein n=1 Tax=Cladophialophora chaetospira TaxID=386627 RepID=A0AA38XC62_9EURO|nr:hypothetical protein H2200_005522 [Cladophialophora chaetospira]